MEKTVIAWTDGACKGNPGPGGWGVILTYAGNEKEISGSEDNTTNNRMEMIAVLEALRAVKLKHFNVNIHTDSNIVCRGINEWLPGWKAKGWKKSNNKQVENDDLWKLIDEELSKFSGKVFCTKVQAHSGIEMNERVDTLASNAAFALQV